MKSEEYMYFDYSGIDLLHSLLRRHPNLRFYEADFENIPAAVKGESGRETCPPDNQLRAVLDPLRSDRRLIDNLEMALKQAMIGDMSYYVEFTADFQLVGTDVPEYDPIRIINKDQFILFNVVSNHVVGGNSCRIQLGGSLYKWLRLRKEQKCRLMPASNLARRILNAPVRLRVFGVVLCSYGGFYVKPYSVDVG